MATVIGNIAPLNPQPVNGTVAATQSGSWTVANSSTAFKLQSSVRVFGGATATLSVPAGQIFRGTVGASGSGNGLSEWGYIVRDTNGSGTQLSSNINSVDGSHTTVSGVQGYVEWSAGVYHVSAAFLGGAYTPTCSIIGGLYANS